MLKSGISVLKSEAQSCHIFLLKGGFLEKAFMPLHSKDRVEFCVNLSKIPAELKKICSSAKIVKKNFKVRTLKPKTIREALSKKLSKEELSFVPKSFDTLGDSAILDVPDSLKGKEKLLAEALIEVNPSIETVFAKTGAHSGVFRSEPVKFVAGKRKKYAIYKENGGVFRISVGKVFFSPRLSTERKRISGLIKKGEIVAALFAGVGPFPIVFAKNSRMEKAYAIELNPIAVEDMKENISLNKVEGKVIPILGDVKKLSSKYAGLCDRAVMPLPKGGEDFLEDAIKYIKPSGGVVHYYQFVPRDNPYELVNKQISGACKHIERKFRVVAKRKVRDYAPDIIQVVVDFKVWE